MMMSLLNLKPSSFLILVILISLVQVQIQSCDAINQAMNCSPSACGAIGNISFPFRLKDDPEHCGNPDYELECLNNVALVYLHSHRYRVKAINYNNFTIRLAHDSVDTNNTCSFPNYSAYSYEFRVFDYPYSRWGKRYPSYNIYGQDFDEVALPINLMSCSQPFNCSSLFTELPSYCAFKSSTTTTTYIKVGHMNVSDLPYMCRIDVIVITSWNFTDFKNTSVSLSEIHHSLLYGFELSWFNYPCSKCRPSDFCVVGEDHTPTCTQLIFAKIRIFPLAFVIVSLFIGMVKIQLAGILITVSFLLFAVPWERLPPQNTFSVEGLLSIAVSLFLLKNFILFPCAVGFMIRKFRRRRLSMYNAIEDFLRSDHNKLMPIRYSYSDIKKMTRGFQQKIGQGGYGMVYKGRLRSGHHVAVKLLGKLRANDQDFMNEIATIGRIHHVNVVTLVGYCAERSKRALVYDFMPNGSLDKYILGPCKTNCLSWEMKYKIAVGVARGIEYLHRGCDIQILHFDIKPHNILLDDNFIPKISDFGLAKFCSTDKNTVTMTAARGTIGYVAPELINGGFGPVSYKADVYSFGMLLIEMASIKKDLKGSNQSCSQYFPDWIYGCLDQGKDIELGNSIDEGEYSARKIGRKMAITALWCIQMRPEDRPSMNKVMEMLEAEIEHLRTPERPTQLSQVAIDMDHSLSTYSTDTVSLLHHDAAAPTFEITVEES